jgi:hypothetical protein
VKHRMTRRGREVALLLWGCIALFAARVIAQFEALVAAPAWLPEMNAWYSGLLPYHLLLPAQVALLMVMAVVAWNRRVRTGRFALANPRVARVLRVVAVVYFLAMALRLGIVVMGHGADFWHEGAIPVAFHWVLALFLLVSARSAGVLPSGSAPMVDDPQADDTPHGDVPALGALVSFGAREA